MTLIIIAALNKNRVIGRDGKIPWHIPEDLQRFKEVTSHHAVLMGRKTFESIGMPLPERKNVVISRRAIAVKDIESFPSIDSALSHLHNEQKVFVIGGGEIFRQTIDRADEMMLTIVENEEPGDTYFPPYEHRIGKELLLTHSEERHGFQFREYRKSRQ